jgi:transcriptional regulator with XRE-family HTH domain
MNDAAEVREFLMTRRARITPAEAGLPVWGGHRRVAGLRREEVALLAGMSVDYYTRLERGNLSGVSDGVLTALARALQLDEAETAHLFDLARAANASPVTRAPRARPAGLRPSILRLLDAITDAPALIRDDRFDFRAANALGRALYAPVFASAAPNSLRYAFLDPTAGDFYPDWDRVTQELVATLRGVVGRDPQDRRLIELVGELSMRSDRFRTLWAQHDVRFHRTGVKLLHHPIVGDLELTYESFDLPADPGLSLSTYTAEPGSRTAEALTLLASWAATKPTDDRDEKEPAHAAHPEGRHHEGAR